MTEQEVTKTEEPIIKLGYWKQRKLTKTYQQFNKLKDKWLSEDRNHKQEIVNAIEIMREKAGLEIFEDDDSPTTKEMLENKTLDELVKILDMILEEARTIVPK